MKNLFLLLLASNVLLAQTPQAPPLLATPSAVSRADIYRSVVRVEVATQNADYQTPWNAGRFSGGIGTAFLIGPNQFMTNAHVISNAKRILINIYGSPDKHTAKVDFVAHDCDLALLSVEDFSPFEKLPVFPIGDSVPQLESQVRVLGYPVGGNRLSVTRGVVSRIDFQPYSHTRADSHLAVQIDAAINPGNSGGPVLQNDQVIGVAFQGLTDADNTGYIIPTPVIRRFLKDVSDGKYDHYVDLGISTFPLINPAIRRALKLSNNSIGVLVTNVTPDSACDAVIHINDVVTSLDGQTVDSAGSILIDGEKVNMEEIVERKFANDTVKLGIIRDGKEMEVEVKLSVIPFSKMYAYQYEKKPRYTIQGGFVFQPLDTNLYAANRFNDVTVRRIYADYMRKGIFKELKDVVILTRVMADEINSQMPNNSGQVVEKINGQEISSFAQAHELLHPQKMPEYFIIHFAGTERPLVIPTASLEQANQRIEKQYGISSLANLSE